MIEKKLNCRYLMQEKADLVEEWRPEPLVPDVPEDSVGLHATEKRIIDGLFIVFNHILMSCHSDFILTYILSMKHTLHK